MSGAAGVTARSRPDDRSAPDPTSTAAAPVPWYRRRSTRESAAAFLFYLALAVVVWWHVWSHHPTSTSACACGDAGLVTWFVAWPAYAISHGLNPFYSTFVYHPYGLNLLSNASSTVYGIVLAPVTWLFGPIATFNLSLTLAPALTGLTMFWLARRWTRWTPAALVSGLFYGFSSFEVGNLATGHLMTASLMLLPLFVLSLEQLLVRQDRSPVRAGAGLGVLAFVQFFVSTEELVIVAVCAACGCVLLVLFGALRAPDQLRRRAGHAVRGLAVAGALGAVLLAWPAWFALAGPAHIPGHIWGNVQASVAGTSLKGLLGVATPTQASDVLTLAAGYFGPPLPDPSVIGIGALAVIALGLVLYRRERALWFFVALGLVTVALAFGDARSLPWAPWRLADHVSVLDNVIPLRILAVTLLCVALALGIVLARTRRAIAAAVGAGTGPTAAGVAGLVGAAALAAAAIVPAASSEWGVLPLTVTALRMPTWFARAATTLPPGKIVVDFPRPTPGSYATIMAWQAVDGMSFVTAEGAGPESAHIPQIPFANGVFERPPAPPTPAEVAAMHGALQTYMVTTAVVLPTSPENGRPTSFDQNLTGILTEATGQAPLERDGALVWDTGPGARPLELPPAVFDVCTRFTPTLEHDLRAEAGCLVSPTHTLASPPSRHLRR